VSKLLFAEVSLGQQEIIAGGGLKEVPITVTTNVPITVTTNVATNAAIGVNVGRNNKIKFDQKNIITQS
jgi:hypothetical protein